MAAQISLASYYQAFDALALEAERRERERGQRRTTLQNYLRVGTRTESSGFQRMQECRRALDALDRRGWQRSFHQRMFHDNFIRACARIFWKREKPGVFAKDHQRILEINGWDHLSQEVLVSTPRRSGRPGARSQKRRALAPIGGPGAAGTGGGPCRSGSWSSSRAIGKGAGGRKCRTGPGAAWGSLACRAGSRAFGACVRQPRRARALCDSRSFRASAGLARPSPSACSPPPCCTAVQAWRCRYTAHARYGRLIAAAPGRFLIFRRARSGSPRSSCGTCRSFSISSTSSWGPPG